MIELRNGATVARIAAQGNRLVELSFAGENILHAPGMPVLAPWANRIPDGFYADGRYCAIAPGISIHGLLEDTERWEVVERSETAVRFRLHFGRYPEWLAKWPFPHEYEMTYRLLELGLETQLKIRNRAEARMPVAVGFHPYFTLPGVPRSRWRARVPAALRMLHDERVLPTGQLVEAQLPEFAPLATHSFDSGFCGLEPEPRFRIEGGGRAIEIHFDSGWPVAIVWGPPGAEFLCVEPMAAPTDGINLHHRGLWAGLQWIGPGDEWSGSFTIRGEGF
jgi:aldose 1-epimerase